MHLPDFSNLPNVFIYIHTYIHAYYIHYTYTLPPTVLKHRVNDKYLYNKIGFYFPQQHLNKENEYYGNFFSAQNIDKLLPLIFKKNDTYLRPTRYCNTFFCRLFSLFVVVSCGC